VEKLIPQKTFKSNHYIIRGYYVLMASNFIIGFLPNVGARCGAANMNGIGGSKYPMCFMILYLFNFVFYLFALNMCCKNYYIDKNIVVEETKK
jgi:hypothetical protein